MFLFRLVSVYVLLTNFVFAMPNAFVYLRKVDPTIHQEMRYASDHNFIGRSIRGYVAGECILTKQAAFALSKVQEELRRYAYSLKVYDCYRPTRAVADFVQWSEEPADIEMKQEFYPRVNKADVFKLGYVALKSGHSRGSTIDLTIVPLSAPTTPLFHAGQKLRSCILPYEERYPDNSIDMGTGFDCMDELSSPLHQGVSTTAFHHRMLLRDLMMKHGFVPYHKEWWHFTLQDEPYPETYFNFRVG